MKVFDNLKELEDYFLEEKKRGRRMSDLYEAVQQASDILQRLYLMVTAGSAFIGSKEAAAKEILKDLIEMAKGIQHPIRGLFLRYFMLKKLKERFPDGKTGTHDGYFFYKFYCQKRDVQDSIMFMLQNLAEMNRLWIRMQHSGPKDKAQREAERNELNMVVGENIVRLSSLEGVDMEMYKNIVLPRLLELIHNCKDAISQQYLMDCIIQVFSDEYHLHTLERLLEACTNLHNNVDVKTIFITLMDRLSNYANSQSAEIAAVDKEIDIFGMFKKFIDRILDEQGAIMDLKKLIELEVAFIRFSIKSYPQRIDHVNSILESASKIIQIQPAKNLTIEVLKNIVKLLTIPLETLSLAVLNMSHFPILMQYLNPSLKKQVAKLILAALINSHTKLENADIVQKLLVFISPLVEGIPGEEDFKDDLYEFEEVQTNVARIVHLVQCADSNTQFTVLGLLKDAFGKGGIHRMKITYPALIWSLLKLASSISKTEEMPLNLKIFENTYSLIEGIMSANQENAIKLMINCVLVMNTIGQKSEECEKLAEKYLNQILSIYQDELADSDMKFKTLTLIIGTLEKITILTPESFAGLAKKVIHHCTKLLKKQDQCKSILMCSHVFSSAALVFFNNLYCF